MKKCVHILLSKDMKNLYTVFKTTHGLRIKTNVFSLHSSVLELRKNQFLKKINILKTFLEIETTHYLEGLDLKLNNETYAKVLNL